MNCPRCGGKTRVVDTVTVTEQGVYKEYKQPKHTHIFYTLQELLDTTCATDEPDTCGRGVYRRRKCSSCNYTFYTLEEVVEMANKHFYEWNANYRKRKGE